MEIKWADGTKPATEDESKALEEIKKEYRSLMVPQFLAAVRTGKLEKFYRGTVPGHVKAKRRARNKVARRSRAINRKGK